MAIPSWLDPNNRPGAQLFASPSAYTGGVLNAVTPLPQQSPFPMVPNSMAAQGGIIQVPEEKPGILGRIGRGLANPAINQRLSALGAELLANSGYHQIPVTTGAGLGRGLQAMNQAGQAYDQMLGSQAAAALDKRMKEAQLKKAEREAQGGGSSFGKAAGAAINPATNQLEVYQLSDTGEVKWTGFAPAETYTYQDVGSEVVGAGRYGGKGQSLRKDVSVDLREREAQKVREEMRAPTVAAEVEAAKAKAGTKVEKEELATSASDALYELTRLDQALTRIPQTKVAQIAENVVAPITGGDPETQAALGEVAQISGRMLKYVERLPGAATDKDRDVFMASAGIMQNPDATISAKRAAVQSAMDSYKRLVEKYGQQKPAASASNAPPAIPRPGEVRNGYKFNGGNPNDKANWTKVR